MEIKTVKQIVEAIRTGETTASAIVEETLKKIHAENGSILAFLETFDEEARAAAKRVDAQVKEGNIPRLAGVPIAIKDNMLYAGHTASASSRMLENYTSSYTATAVKRLEEAGAIIVGRTNMDEFAMGSSTETSAFGDTKNPWDTERVPGGSSGGSAAAVAAGLVPAALGSDTGGSIRQPASFCGVVGFKPTYGRVSRYGLIAMASSLDQIGPITRTVGDAALLLEVMEGKDPQDATSLELTDTTVAELLPKDLQGVTIGVPKEFFIEGMDVEAEKRVREAIALLAEQGAEIVEVSLPLTKYALPAYYIIQPAEASSNLARFDGLRYGTRSEASNLKEAYLRARGQGFGREVKRRIMLGTYILSAGYYDAYYKKALAVRTALHHELQEVMKTVDVLVTPTSPGVAWKLGEKLDDPITMYLADILTTTANITGAPAISVPCGFSQNLPVGLQFMAGHLEDEKVLRAAAVFEQCTPWHTKTP